MRIYLSPPHMGPEERALLLDAFDSNWIAPLGPHVDAFEREVAGKVGAKHAVALSSGTAAIHLALQILGVKTGDEVLVSTLTFSASVNPIAYVGAAPVLIDSSPDTWNLDPGLVEEELAACARRGKLPAAVIAVDLYGQAADLDPLRATCARHGVPLVEDAAEALGATYRGHEAGTLGDIGIYSFNGNKIITTSGGGMLVTERQDVADRARYLATQARDPAPHYQHSQIGFNYRMSNLLAAVGRGQLRVLEDRVRRRREHRAYYAQTLGRLPGITLMPEAPYGQANAWLTCITVDPLAFGATREDIRLHLASMDIESRPVWKPMHLQPIFAACRKRGGEVAEGLFDRGLCLPSGSNLTDADRAEVARAVESVRR